VSGAPRKSGLRNSPASGNCNGCSAIIHRTCPVYIGLSGVTAGQRLPRANGYLRRIKCARCARRGQARPCWRTRHSTVHVRCAPDCPMHHTTDSLHQRSCLVVGAINTPTTPSFMASKFSTSQLLTRALAFNSRHTKEIKSSPNSTQHPSD
jgi:hypothetical protein